jgi:hypothetical protein
MINNINIIILVIIAILIIFLCKYKEFFNTSSATGNNSVTGQTTETALNLVIKQYKHFINRVLYNSSCTTSNIIDTVEIQNNDISSCINRCIDNDSCKSISTNTTHCKLHSEICDSNKNNYASNTDNTDNSEYIYNINHDKNINTQIVNLLETELTDIDNSLTLVSDIIDNVINKYNNSVIKLYDIIQNNTLSNYNNSIDIINIFLFNSYRKISDILVNKSIYYFNTDFITKINTNIDNLNQTKNLTVELVNNFKNNLSIVFVLLILKNKINSDGFIDKMNCNYVTLLYNSYDNKQLIFSDYITNIDTNEIQTNYKQIITTFLESNKQELLYKEFIKSIKGNCSIYNEKNELGFDYNNIFYNNNLKKSNNRFCKYLTNETHCNIDSECKWNSNKNKCEEGLIPQSCMGYSDKDKCNNSKYYDCEYNDTKNKCEYKKCIKNNECKAYRHCIFNNEPINSICYDTIRKNNINICKPNILNNSDCINSGCVYFNKNTVLNPSQFRTCIDNSNIDDNIICDNKFKKEECTKNNSCFWKNNKCFKNDGLVRLSTNCDNFTHLGSDFCPSNNCKWINQKCINKFPKDVDHQQVEDEDERSDSNTPIYTKKIDGNNIDCYSINTTNNDNIVNECSHYPGCSYDTEKKICKNQNEYGCKIQNKQECLRNNYNETTGKNNCKWVENKDNKQNGLCVENDRDLQCNVYSKQNCPLELNYDIYGNKIDLQTSSKCIITNNNCENPNSITPEPILCEFKNLDDKDNSECKKINLNTNMSFFTDRRHLPCSSQNIYNCVNNSKTMDNVSKCEYNNIENSCNIPKNNSIVLSLLDRINSNEYTNFNSVNDNIENIKKIQQNTINNKVIGSIKSITNLIDNIFTITTYDKKILKIGDKITINSNKKNINIESKINNITYDNINSIYNISLEIINNSVDSRDNIENINKLIETDTNDKLWIYKSDIMSDIYDYNLLIDKKAINNFLYN